MSLSAHTSSPNSHWAWETRSVNMLLFINWAILNNISHPVESPTSIHSRIRIFASTAKRILAFDEYWLHNTREYLTNTRIFDIREYSCPNEYEYSDIREYQSSIRASTIYGGLRYTRLLCKGIIYTIRGPNIQLYMREYTREMINLMYGAQRRVRIVRI